MSMGMRRTTLWQSSAQLHMAKRSSSRRRERRSRLPPRFSPGMSARINLNLRRASQSRLWIITSQPRGTGMPAMRLFAESPRLFFIKDIDAQIEFFTNDKGQVTHLLLHQPGRDNKGIKQLSQSGPQLAVAG